MSTAAVASEFCAPAVAASPTDVTTCAALHDIHAPDHAAVVWKRELDRDLAAWLAQLPAEMLPTERIVLRPEQVGAALDATFSRAATPECAERDVLQGDIARLATTFAEILSVPFVRLRLEAVSNNACSKFHIDAVRARLICTYRGTGTQFSEQRGDASAEDVVTVPTSAPVILRGTLWPVSESARLYHRSPPIAGTGTTRLLLVLDPIDDPDAEADPVFL
ncbi:MAG: DUF1826 domain-containing protein [Pseudomonadota bacterium]